MINNTKTELLERAWADMELTLDREMPVHKSKRRVIIWYWALGLFILVGIIGTIVWKDLRVDSPKLNVLPNVSKVDIAEQSKITELANEGMIAQGDEVTPTNSLESTQNRIIGTIQSKSNGIGANVSRISHEIPPLYEAQIPLLQNGPTAVIPQQTNLLPHSAKNDDHLFVGNAEIPSIDYKAETSAFESSSPNKQSLPITLASSPLDDDPPSILLDRLPLASPLVTGDFEKLEIPSISFLSGVKATWWDVYCTGGLGLGTQKQKALFAGLGTSYETKSISLFTDISYHHFIYNNSIVYALDLGNNEPEFSTAELPIDLKSLLQSREELVWRLGLGKKFGNRFVLNSAFSISYLLSSRNSVLDVPVSVGPESDTGGSTYYEESNGFLTEGKMRRYDIAPSVGFSFFITPSLSIEANYTHGLRNVFNTNNTDQTQIVIDSDISYNRYARLGVRYKIF